MFNSYFKLGLNHVADIHAYDHIVFIIAMSAVYMMPDWKKLAVMVTSFTIGHSITLALATFRVVMLPSYLIEFLIPVTILITSTLNLFSKNNRHHKLKYVLVLFFGLIHGLGFSNFLVVTLSQESGIIMPLFAFNVGLEAGQLLIVFVYMMLAYVVLKIFKVPVKDWLNYVCGLTSGIAIILMLNTKFW